MPPKSQKKKIKKLTEAVKQCNISSATSSSSTKQEPELIKTIELDDVLDPQVLAKWPKRKMKVPAIFLHKTHYFSQHARKLVALGVNFFQPSFGINFIRIYCHSFDDHKAMLQYFDKNQLPYHTFGHPSKRKMKVIIRGLPKDIDLNEFKAGLKALSIPIVRVHTMHLKEYAKDKDKDILVLAVVPYDDEGKKLLRLKKVFGNEVKLEPPHHKVRQCHRCQKWGHSQRYCHGDIRCVKCAGDHMSKKCTRDPEAEPPTCANCGGEHTASYRQCPYCPESVEYKFCQLNKVKRMQKLGTNRANRERQLVTLENIDALYKRVKDLAKPNEPVPLYIF